MNDRAVLCVDDEKHVVASLKRLLRKEPYAFLAASDAEAGLALLDTQPVQVVVSDQRMPGMSGIEFLQKVKEQHPHSVRVILSGYADVESIVESINKGEVYRFFTKPWNDEELKASIRQCLEHYDLVVQNQSMTETIRAQNEVLLRWNESLEETVSARTRSLQMSQEILEKLPVPIIGVSQEGMIVLANEATGKMFPSMARLPPGIDMREVVPPEVVERLRLCHGQSADEAIPAFQTMWDEHAVRVRITPLESNGARRGLIVMLDADDFAG